MVKVVYFDNNATTEIDPEVLELMHHFLQTNYGNPSSWYSLGASTKKAIDEARGKVSSLLKAEEKEIIFTSGATESNNTALISCFRTLPDKKHIITSAVEHSSIITTLTFLKNQGYKITFLPVDPLGNINLDNLENLITKETGLVSIMYANNETGNIYPIEKIVKRVKAKNQEILFHTDAVQAIGKVDINVRESNIDFLSLSGHKFHAPKGVGALFIKAGTPFTPLIFGGHQEREFRGGTENTASIIALGKAAEIAHANLGHDERIKELRDYIEKEIIAKFKDVSIFGDRERRLSNTSNIGFLDLKGEAIQLCLAEKGIFVSTGSACNSKSTQPSHVLKAMSVPENRIRSIRISLSKFNNKAEVDYFLSNLIWVIKSLEKVKEKRRNVGIN